MAEQREQLLSDIAAGARQSTTDGVVLHQAIADRLGLHVTDLRCLNTLRPGDAVTAGELAERTGLTTGAVTRMIDRLLKAGYVRREHDQADRRRVIISLVPERAAQIAPHYQGVAAAWTRLMGDYTDEQLGLIRDLFGRMHQMSVQLIAELDAENRPDPNS
ncbi:MarR family transcriptional regulator [Solihabitans fulvus]|uniref:MarR family transcriptional regulator n=1 Tax=Solihabitans fulvus TaxID=1892852 RepID=A0A5B2WVX7_9PSEU|nr:MarR family transcriptional regulator [Solihabitans fulvus]KAA2254067.1 MarR family transcriptional regulator [Solihabitans fulvus]